MRNIPLVIVAMIAIVATGCHYEAKIFYQEREFVEEPAHIYANSSVPIQMKCFVNGKPGEFKEGKIKIEYHNKEGGRAFDVETQFLPIKNGAIHAVIPLPIAGAVSTVATITGKCHREWLTRTVIVSKPAQVPLTVKILAEGAENGLLAVKAGNTIELKAQISGGVSPYQYKWLGPQQQTISLNANAIITDFTCRKAGTYTLEVTDSGGNVAIGS